MRTHEGDMKDDAFDDVECPFDYKAELRKARDALDAKVGRYMSDHRTKDYRWLARKFSISSGKLSAIAKGYKHKRKRGTRPGNLGQKDRPYDGVADVA